MHLAALTLNVFDTQSQDGLCVLYVLVGGSAQFSAPEVSSFCASVTFPVGINAVGLGVCVRAGLRV